MQVPRRLSQPWRCWPATVTHACVQASITSLKRMAEPYMADAVSMSQAWIAMSVCAQSKSRRAQTWVCCGRQGTFIRNERALDLDAMQRHESLVALGERVAPATTRCASSLRHAPPVCPQEPVLPPCMSCAPLVLPGQGQAAWSGDAGHVTGCQPGSTRTQQLLRRRRSRGRTSSCTSGATRCWAPSRRCSPPQMAPRRPTAARAARRCAAPAAPSSARRHRSRSSLQVHKRCFKPSPALPKMPEAQAGFFGCITRNAGNIAGQANGT